MWQITAKSRVWFPRYRVWFPRNTALYGKLKIKVNANTPYTEILVLLGDSKDCLQQLKETDTLNTSCQLTFQAFASTADEEEDKAYVESEEEDADDADDEDDDDGNLIRTLQL